MSADLLEIVGRFAPSEITREEIGMYMLGIKRQDEVTSTQ